MTTTISLTPRYTIVNAMNNGAPGFHVYRDTEVLRNRAGEPYFYRQRSGARKAITRDRRRTISV